MDIKFEKAYERLDQFIEEYMEGGNFPGLAIALTDREKLLHTSAHGLADVSAKTPVTTDTLFEIGSIGKSFTSLALLQLRDEGKIDLHEPITRYLPWFQIQSKYESITPHHLMSHTGGICWGAYFPSARYETWALRETEATTAPGTHFRYSNAGFDTLGIVLEDVSGQSYGDYLQERIFDALGMTKSYPVITNKTREDLSVGYWTFYYDRPLNRGGVLAPATWLETSAGAGSPASTVTDMASYLRMYLNRGQGPQGEIISEESFEMMTQKVIASDWIRKDSFYGYGLEIHKEDGHTYIGHGGGMVGYSAFIMMDMDEGLGAVVLTNGLGNPGQVVLYALKLLRAALDGQELPELPSPPDPTKIKNAADYAGTYQNDTKSFTLVAEGKKLILNYGDERIALEQHIPDNFYVNHPDLLHFLLRFSRNEDGKVVEAFHGADWYINDDYTGETKFDYPAEWDAYTGHYLSYNPFRSNFRIVLRKGALALIFFAGDDSGLEELLVPLENGVFRVGEEEFSPERISFNTLINGQMMRARLSCYEFYRVSTP